MARLLLEPKLGAVVDGPASGAASGASSGASSGTLSWKSYRWDMSSVWLENVLTKQPARWLPPGYSDYGSLLTVAVENAVKQAGVPPDLSQWKWGQNFQVEIDHLVLNRLPVIRRFAGPRLHPLSGSGQTVKQVGRGFGPSERLTWNFANFDESTLTVVTGARGIFLTTTSMDH